jgi:hypothetical protein
MTGIVDWVGDNAPKNGMLEAAGPGAWNDPGEGSSSSSSSMHVRRLNDPGEGSSSSSSMHVRRPNDPGEGSHHAHNESHRTLYQKDCAYAAFLEIVQPSISPCPLTCTPPSYTPPSYTPPSYTPPSYTPLIPCPFTYTTHTPLFACMLAVCSLMFECLFLQTC